MPAQPIGQFLFGKVPRRKSLYRHDQLGIAGVTPELQRRFVATLVATGIVKVAARRIGKSLEALYKLRHRPGAEDFAEAWDAALERGVARLEEIAMERAMIGTRTPIVSSGEILGHWDKPDNSLLRFLLSHRMPARYSPVRRDIGPGHPVYEDLLQQMEVELCEEKWQLSKQVTARAIALQTYRARRRAEDARRLGADARPSKDVWDGETIDGIPQLPRWGDPALFEKVEEYLDEMERERPF